MNSISEAWGELVRATLADTARLAQRPDAVSNGCFANLDFSETLSIKLGETSIKRAGSSIFIEVRIRRVAGGAHLLSHVHGTLSDSSGLTAMLEEAVRVGKACSKDLLEHAFRMMTISLIEEAGLPRVRAEFNDLVAESIMES